MEYRINESKIPVWEWLGRIRERPGSSWPRPVSWYLLGNTPQRPRQRTWQDFTSHVSALRRNNNQWECQILNSQNWDVYSVFYRWLSGQGGPLLKRKAGLGSAPRVGLSLSFKSRALMTPAGIQRDQSAMYQVFCITLVLRTPRCPYVESYFRPMTTEDGVRSSTRSEKKGSFGSKPRPTHLNRSAPRSGNSRVQHFRDRISLPAMGSRKECMIIINTTEYFVLCLSYSVFCALVPLYVSE